MTRPRDFLAILLLGAAATIAVGTGFVGLEVIDGLARVHTGEVVLR